MKITMELWSKVNKELALRGMEEAPFGEIRDAMENTERTVVELIAEEISLFRRRYARVTRTFACTASIPLRKV
jgi:hypothetical protein